MYFYPRSPCGERHDDDDGTTVKKNFYPRSPCGERPFLVHYQRLVPDISIHALLAESDVPLGFKLTPMDIFLSTLSLRRATAVGAGYHVAQDISIHALLAESDWSRRVPGGRRRHFYPRSPCGERPGYHRTHETGNLHFYPRSPCGERRFLVATGHRPQAISIHALLAESDCGPGRRGGCGQISIHALLAESDSSLSVTLSSPFAFLSTLSLRRATFHCLIPCSLYTFLSTLSLRRATILKLQCVLGRKHFYPRSPCGERLFPGRIGFLIFPFLSTLSLRRATNVRVVEPGFAKFLSTLSLRRATALSLPFGAVWVISIHALLAESDSKSAQNSRALLRGRDTFYGIGITILAVIGSFYPFCPCFFHIFWCEGTGNFMIAFPSH